MLWNIIEKRGHPKHLIRTLNSLYVHTGIIINGKQTKEIEINKRVRQGCCISTTLFTIYIDNIMLEWKDRNNTGIFFSKIIILNSLLYTDDTVLVAEENNLQKAAY